MVQPLGLQASDCKGPEFHPWLGNWIHMWLGPPQKIQQILKYDSCLGMGGRSL